MPIPEEKLTAEEMRDLFTRIQNATEALEEKVDKIISGETPVNTQLTGSILKQSVILINEVFSTYTSKFAITQAAPWEFKGETFEWYCNLTVSGSVSASDAEKLYAYITYSNLNNDWTGPNIVREVIPFRRFYSPIPTVQNSNGFFLLPRRPMNKYMTIQIVYRGSASIDIRRFNMFEVTPKGGL